MPRNRYTKFVRIRTRVQIERQEVELRELGRELHRLDPQSALLPIRNEEKERRSARVDRKRRSKRVTKE
ncbi:hypothetical protein M8542_14505 [Amycolatopsis sp. OK19-0408]|uniref:Uncharacterized protein n=1 Tax=Amycolatopsis iheyensis TaxID=2945988 RepID=A0A9X2NA27_9PSEU|nr:hypothetical protein [Amycolatopsis iheyensis]MCR6484032.1 hypothetical protein [Amycolatopsis iheyensis]